MEIENTGQEEMDLGFTPVPAGTYIYQLMDGVELIVSEDSDSKGYRIPLQVDAAHPDIIDLNSAVEVRKAIENLAKANIFNKMYEMKSKYRDFDYRTS